MVEKILLMPWGWALTTEVRRWVSRGSAPLGANELYLLTVHLETMLRCGLSIVAALDILCRGPEAQPRAACAPILTDVASGMSLSRAMARQPESFPPSYCRVVETGEATGQMAACLGRLARSLQQQHRTTRLLTSALVYPLFLVFSCSAMVIVMLYLVFPMILSVTQDAGVEPPALTRALIFITGWDKLALLAGGAVLGGVGVAALVRHPRLGPRLRRWAEERLPPGRFFARTKVVASLRQLAVMLESGVDLLTSLNYSCHVGEESLLVSEAFEDIVGRVRAGEALAPSFARHPVFPKSVPGMLSVAEEVADTQAVLHRVADMLEADLSHKISVLTAAFEPVVMACMGLVVGTLLLAALLPIYNLVTLA